jgi:hypothetical protein
MELLKKSSSVTRFTYFMGVIATLCLVGGLFAIPSSAKRMTGAGANTQYPFDRFDRQEAINGCQEEARHRLVADLGTWGARYDLSFDRNPQATQASAAKMTVDGTGRFSPGSGARSRPFKYSCVYSIQSRRVSTLNYEFTDPNQGNQNRPGWDGGGYRPPPSYNPGGRVWYSGAITNRNSEKALDVQERSTRDEGNVQQWSFADQPNQRWDVIDLGGGQFSIISQGSNKALDIARGSDRDGANVQQFRWHGGDNQRWYLQRQSGGWYQIVNVHSGKCLDVESKSRENGGNIQQWSCSGASNQAWKFGR